MPTKLVVFSFAFLTVILLTAASAQVTKYPLQCTNMSFRDCAEFQDYWDHADLRKHNDCTFPPDAKACWDPSAFIIKACRQSPVGVNFIDTHDHLIRIFTRAYQAGEFGNYTNLMAAWEHLNGSTLYILYPIDHKAEIEADLARLNIPDAIWFAYLLVRYADNLSTLVKMVNDIAANVVACTDIEKKIPGFIDEVVGSTMRNRGMWLVEAHPNEPLQAQKIYEGSQELTISFSREACAGSPTPPSVLIESQRADGSRHSVQLQLGAPPQQVTGVKIVVRVIKKVSDWPRYSCATGKLS